MEGTQMGDTTVTVSEPPDGEKPTNTPDTVAETAVAAISETSRSTAQAEVASQRAQDASYTATDAEDQAKNHADRAQQAADSIGQWATSISDAVAQIPEKIAHTLQALVTSAPNSTPDPQPTETTTPPAVSKPRGHWTERKLFSKGES